MKRILFLFSLLLAVSAQAQESAKAQQVKYTVKGVSNENGKMIYLEYQRCNGTNGLLSLAKEKHAYSDHPLVRKIVDFSKQMSNQTIVVKSARTKAQKDGSHLSCWARK